MKVDPLTDFTDRFAPGAALWAGGARHAVRRSRAVGKTLLLELEGIYCEPAGAAGLAAARIAHREGIIAEDEPVVCLITCHGFKDPDSIVAAAARFPSSVVAPEELEDALA